MNNDNVVRFPKIPLWQTESMSQWEKTKRLYPEVVTRLEQAKGPDRLLDIDVAILLGRADHDAQCNADPRCRNGNPVPYFTRDLSAIEAYILDQMSGFKWSVQEWPIDAQVFLYGEPGDDGELEPEFWSGAWKDGLGEPQMNVPPANVAIALTLAVMRNHDEMCGH